jgi:hypothetical protein
MNLNELQGLNGKRVILRQRPGADTVVGDVVHVSTSFLHGGDVDLAIRLEDGTVKTVLGSQLGTAWDLAE